MKYTEKERRESAESVLKRIKKVTDPYANTDIDTHFAKFDPPDPDKELRDRFEEYEAWAVLTEHSTHFKMEKAIELKILATEARLNEVRVEVLEEVQRRFEDGALFDDIFKELRTRYSKGVE